MGRTRSAEPVDIFGTEIKKGSLLAYAVSQGQVAVLKVAVASADPAKNKNGVWKVQVRPLYTPGGVGWGSNREVLHNDGTRKTSIEVSARLLVLPMTEAQVRESAGVRDASRRLGDGE